MLLLQEEKPGITVFQQPEDLDFQRRPVGGMMFFMSFWSIISILAGKMAGCEEVDPDALLFDFCFGVA